MNLCVSTDTHHFGVHMVISQRWSTLSGSVQTTSGTAGAAATAPVNELRVLPSEHLIHTAGDMFHLDPVAAQAGETGLQLSG